MMNKEDLKQKFLNQRSSQFTIILNDNEQKLFRSPCYINEVITMSVLPVLYIASIRHDKDMDESTQQLKTVHYHVVVEFDKQYRIGTIINYLMLWFGCNENQITIDKCVNLCQQSRYLIHLDDGDKYPYLPFDVDTNNEELYKKFITTEKIKDLSQCVSIVKRYNYDLEAIMLNITNYDKWRRYINDLIINFNRRRY